MPRECLKCLKEIAEVKLGNQNLKMGDLSTKLILLKEKIMLKVN